MIKTYSTLTGKYYNSTTEAEAAEKQFNEDKYKAEKVQAEVETKINEIKKQRNAEVKACSDELAAINASIENLSKYCNECHKKIEDFIIKRDKIREDIHHINSEADFEISKCLRDSKTNVKDQPECTIKVATFNSEKDKDWNTIINEKGTVDDVLKKLGEIKFDTKADLKGLLKLFDI